MAISAHFSNTPEELDELLKTKTATAIAREKGKDAFILKASLLKTIKGMSVQEKGIIFEMIINYVLDDVKPSRDSVEGMSATFFIQAIEDADKKYIETCIKNSENRKKRDEAKKETVANGDGPFN